MLTIRQIKLIRKKKFIATPFNLKDEAFIIYIIFFSLNLSIYLLCIAQIALLKADEAYKAILFKYDYFANIFSSNFIVSKLLKNIKINNHTINLIKS